MDGGPAGNRLRRLAELSPDTAPGKVHQRRSTERIGKETAQEMPGATCKTKSYPVPGGPAQSVRLSYVWWKLSYRDQPHNCPQRPAQQCHRGIEDLLSNKMGGGSDGDFTRGEHFANVLLHGGITGREGRIG